MNPFEMQAEFTRQWFEFATTMTSKAIDAYAAMNHQLVSSWTDAMSRSGTSAMTPGFPMSAWQPTPAPALPMGMLMPFASPAQTYTNPFAPWMSPFGSTSWIPSGTPFGSASYMAWPWAMGAMRPSPFDAWLNPFGARPSHSGAEMIEQAVATYRSASGYAVAAIIAPLEAAIDPKKPNNDYWWQSPYTKRDLN
jgi:hypothetical protein